VASEAEEVVVEEEEEEEGPSDLLCSKREFRLSLVEEEETRSNPSSQADHLPFPSFPLLPLVLLDPPSPVVEKDETPPPS